MQAKLDILLEKAISRKLLVWVTATGLMLTANLASSDWVIISGLYLGGQGIIDAIAKLKGH
jgi:predicted Rossmann fold nucleotide-binding protein DprA/Smf involved in DNA uptake|tara:strand:+ start:110 stop:292 length:183 start_codon:yes stop_codon:yes gene_type:complete